MLADQRVPEAMELSVLCVDRDAIAELNARHMGAKGPTDAPPSRWTSWARPGPASRAARGNVALRPDVAAEQAGPVLEAMDTEVELLLVHGILHLSADDHAEVSERHRMFGLTERLLTGFRSEGARGQIEITKDEEH